MMNWTKSNDTTNWTILSIAVHVLGWHPLWSTPHFVGMSSCPGYHLVLVFLLFWQSSCLVQWGYKATFLPAVWVPLHVGGSTLHQGVSHQLIHPPEMEGYLPITSSYLVLQNHDPVPVVVSVMGFTIRWHLQARMLFPWLNIHVPSDAYTYCTLPGVFTHLQCMLWWMSTVEVITSH